MSKKSGVKVDVKRDSTKGRLWSRLGVVPFLATTSQRYDETRKQLDSLNKQNKALMDSLHLKQMEVDSLKLIQEDTVRVEIKIVTDTK